MSSHKIEIRLIRNKALQQTLSPESFSGDSTEFEMTTQSSIGEYPTANIISRSPLTNPLFMSFSKNDVLQIFISSKDSAMKKIFEGEFLEKKTELNNEHKSLEIKTRAIHSFFKLQFLSLSGAKSFKSETLSNLLSEFKTQVNIPSQIIIADDVDQEIKIGVAKGLNALQLVKMICIQKNLCITLKEDNSVLIENKLKKRSDIINSGPVTTINQSDVISMEYSE